ncbi:MAG: Fe-S cluster assembly protein SufD [Deltaproteobacteria bacterium]
MNAAEASLVSATGGLPPAPEFVAAARRAGRDAFERSGLPGTRQEDWRFTSLAPLAAHAFGHGDPAVPVLAGDLERVAGKPFGARLVFVNGRFRGELSTAHGMPTGVHASSLAHAISATPGLVESRLGRTAMVDGRPFAALNAAFLGDGAFVHVGADARGGVVELVFATASTDGPVACHPRVLVVADPGGDATLVETYVALGDHPVLTNAVTEVSLGAGARLDHYQVQDQPANAFHFATLTVEQGTDARLSTHSTALGAALSRSDVLARLVGEGAEVHVAGLYMADGKRLVDNHSVIEHVVPRGTSREIFKGILDGAARGVFAGRIRVMAGASKADAHQHNSNLLLSRDAVVDALPQLEIYTDDVKAGHGGTVGELDREALFYLRSRGIPAPAARGLLIYAFAREMVDRVAVPALRDRLGQQVAARLAGGGAILEAE